MSDFGNALIAKAATDFARTMDPYGLADIAGDLQCLEVEDLAYLLRVTGYPGKAAVLMEAHAERDDDPDDLHYIEPTTSHEEN